MRSMVEGTAASTNSDAEVRRRKNGRGDYVLSAISRRDGG
jgi:hypothetical protein